MRTGISRNSAYVLIRHLSLLLLAGIGVCLPISAQTASFHNAPAAAEQTKNPYAGKRAAAQAGANEFAQHCAACHGKQGEGTGNIPALAKGPAQSATDGAIFWFITQGDPNNGMPAWTTLSEQQRWQVVTYVKALGGPHPPLPTWHPGAATPTSSAASTAPPPTAPFTDYRYEKPGTVRKITVADLPHLTRRSPRTMARNWCRGRTTPGRKLCQGSRCSSMPAD